MKSRRWVIWCCLAALAVPVGHARATDNSPPRFDTGESSGVSSGGGALNVRNKIFDNVGIDQKLDSQIPGDATFTDDNNQQVHLSDYFGKRPIILMFVELNCPMLCTPALNDLCRAMNMMPLNPGTDYDIVTISFDPREDSKLAFMKKRIYVSQVAKSTDALRASWHFLTGTDDNIKRVTAAAGFRYLYDKDKDQYFHVTGLMVLTPEGHVSKYFYGLEYSPNDLRLALAEADESHIGSVATELLLYCYHYDPATGKYDVAVGNLLRLGGSVTLAILAGFVTVQFARDKSRKLASEGLAREEESPKEPD